jgi:hypothetical protein
MRGPDCGKRYHASNRWSAMYFTDYRETQGVSAFGPKRTLRDGGPESAFG